MTIQRSIVVLLLFVWVAAPVFACVPTAAMTDAEMACCQKMGGDCDMGEGNHSCCKGTMHRAPSVAALAQGSQTDLPVVAIATTTYVHEEPSAEQHGYFRRAVGRLDSSPLTLKSVLKI